MKTILYSFSLCVALVILGSSCTPKITEPLLKIQEQEYAVGWKKLDSYPIKRGRTDDLHFFDEKTGFVINSGGYLVYTEDGGENWEVMFENRGTFFRCITFKNRQEGWLGTIGTDDPYLSSRDTIALYETKDGGKNWTPVQFIGPNPKGLCGLQKVTNDFIVGVGRVRGPSYFIKTNDGGKNWYSYDLNHIAGSLIAAHFFDESRGFIIGGSTRDKENCRSMVLETLDGGTTWDTVYLSEQIGEYPWKFAFPTRDKGFISIQRNIRTGKFYHLQTEDGGKTWKEVIHSPEGYYYVQGIGFINEKKGWIGGSNTFTYETIDGGKTWKKLREIGNGFNNFQFFNDNIAYGVGFGVFKNDNVSGNASNIKRTFYQGGNLKSTTTFNQKKKNGKAKSYYPNGNLSSIGDYKNNLKHGKWKYYDENGNITDQVKMKNGLTRVSKKKLRSYEGDYKTPQGDIRKIILEGEQLFSKRGDGEKFEIFPETDSRFYYVFNPSVTIEFFKDENGTVTHSQSYSSNGNYSKAIKQK